MTDDVIVATPLNRTDVYHTTEQCLHVKQIREHKTGRGWRRDLSKDMLEQWGKTECTRCKALRTNARYTDVTADD